MAYDDQIDRIKTLHGEGVFVYREGMNMDPFCIPKPLLHTLINIRRDLHAHPELGFKETRTSHIIAQSLRALPNIEVHTGVADTGVVAVLRTGRPGRCIALRADIDALPIDEASELPYRSTHPGVMHACGHDGHTAALLGAATILSGHADQLSGNVVFLFQPAEEQFAGAKHVCDEGVLERFEIEAIYGMHGWPGVPQGTVCVAEDAAMAASDGFTLKLRGKGVHASTPHLGTDPFYALGHLLLAIQAIPSRMTDARESVVISVGAIHGGSVGNIIPENVTVHGTVRTLFPEIRQRTLALVEKVVQGVAQTFDVGVSFDHGGGYPPVVNTARERNIVVLAAEQMGSLNYPYPPVLAGEDFSFYLERIPGAFWFIGLGDRAPLHAPNFDFNDAVLERAITMHCQIARLATSNENRSRS